MNFKKVITVTLSLLAVSSVVGCSNNKSSKSDVNNKSEQKADPDQAKLDFKAKYDQIKLDNDAEQLKGKKVKKVKGASYKKVKKVLGEPSSVSTPKNSDVKKIYKWKKKEMAIEVGFYKGNRAISKVISGLTWNDEHKITVKEFNSIKVGSSYASIIKKFGKPNQQEETYIYGDKEAVALYFHRYSKDRKIVYFIFVNDRLTSKIRSNLKNTLNNSR